MDFLKFILQRKQLELFKYIKKHLKHRQYHVQQYEKFIYAEGNIPILLVAHLDTVHQYMPSQIFIDQEQEILWSPQGIGGDDRCGVYSILKIIDDGYMPHVLFTQDEEVGAFGARHASNLLSPDINFMVELDRQGNNQAVFYDCGNEDFMDYILSFGFDLEYGTFSDISILSPKWDIASVNLSIGYYNEHTKSEYICLNSMYNTIDKVKKILDDKQNKFYDFQEVFKSYNRFGRLIDFTEDEFDLFYDDYYRDNSIKGY